MQSVSFIVCNTSSIVLLEGNLAETGLIAFIIRNFQLSTYLEINCWKLHKVPLTLTSSKKRHACCLLITLIVTFFSLVLFVIFRCNAACLWLSTTSAFLSFPFFLQIFFSIFLLQSFLGIPFVFENQVSPFWIIYINIYTINLPQMKLYCWCGHSSTTSKTERVFRKFSDKTWEMNQADTQCRIALL